MAIKKQRTPFELDEGQEYESNPQLVLIRSNKKKEIVSVKLCKRVSFHVPELKGKDSYRIMSYPDWLEAKRIYEGWNHQAFRPKLFE